MDLLKNLSRIFSILILIAALNSSLLSQPDKPKFEKLSLEKGIAHNLTYCMMKDSKGFIWFGTMHGLVKYDGKNFKLYRNDPADPSSISFDDIISLYEDTQKNIWIGTWGGGLNQFNPSTEIFKRFVHNPDDSSSIGDNIIWAITEDAENNIWFSTGNSGVQKYDPGKNIFTSYLKDIPVQSLLKDKNGNLWIGGRNNFFKYFQKDNSFKNIPLIVDGKKIPSYGITSLFEDSKNNFLLGTTAGLIKFNRENNSGSLIEENGKSIGPVNNITEDSNGCIWVGTFKGLRKIDQQNNVSSYFFDFEDVHSLSGNNIRSLLYDNSGVLWIAVYDREINKLIFTKNKFEHFTFAKTVNKPTGSHVTSFAEDKNKNIWIGTLNGELNKFDPVKKTFRSISFPGNNFYQVNNIASDEAGNLWIGTHSGLLKFNTTNESFEEIKIASEMKGLLQRNILSTFADNDFIWIGTAGFGLIRIDRNDNSAKHYPNLKLNNQAPEIILTIYKDKSGGYWFGTYNGLFKYNSCDDTFTSFIHDEKNKNSLSHNYVFTMFEDSRGNFWIGTSNGLNNFDRNKKTFTHYYERNGLSNSVICGIVEDNSGSLWISTYGGLSNYNHLKNEFKNFSSSDGLQGNIFNNSSSLKSSDGKIYFGGKNGFNLFVPEDIRFDNFSPPVYITEISSLTSDGKQNKILPGNNIELSFDENTLNFEFAALDFKYPEKINYQYMLEGFDNNWINAGNVNKAIYTNIPDGNYLFKVRATNSDGISSEHTASISVNILPPFWKTWWFISLSVISVILLLYLAHRARLKTKIKKVIEIANIRAEEEEKIRRKTAIDFHDELGHRLTRISLLTEILKRKIGNTYSEILPILNKISENSQQLYDGTRDFIWSIDPQKDSFTELLIRLKDFGDDIFNGTDIQFDVNGIWNDNPKLCLTTDWRRHLALIFKEGMNNTLKHSYSKRVVLESSINENELEISLTDDGKGFEHPGDSSGNGLKNMRKRAEKLSGVLDINSKPGSGTRITFRGKIPKNSLHFN